MTLLVSWRGGAEPESSESSTTVRSLQAVTAARLPARWHPTEKLIAWQGIAALRKSLLDHPLPHATAHLRSMMVGSLRPWRPLRRVLLYPRWTNLNALSAQLKVVWSQKVGTLSALVTAVSAGAPTPSPDKTEILHMVTTTVTLTDRVSKMSSKLMLL